MADNKTQIIISAVDQASGPIAKVQQSLGSLTAAMPALAGALSIGALTSWIKGNIDAADTLNDLSQRVGIGIKQLAGWKLAAEQSGTSMEAVAKAVKGLSVYMVDHADKLRAAGITATDADGAMTQLADLFQAMPDGIEKTALAVQLFGRAGMEMIPMLNIGSKGLAEAKAKSADYAKALEELAPKADKFNDTLRELKMQSELTGLSFTDKIITPMQTLADALKDARSGADGLYKAIRKLDELTGDGPLSIFKVLALGADMQRPRSIGYSGPKNAQGLPMSEEEQFSAATDAYMADGPARAAAAAARKRAQGLLDKSTAGGGSADTALQRMLALGQKNLAGSVDSEEEQRIAATKRDMEDARNEFAALQRMLKVGENNELAAYYETAGEETMRMVAAQRELKNAGKDTFAELTRAIEGWGNKFTDTMADMVMTGKGNFSDLANSIIRDLLRIQIQKNVTDPLIKSGTSVIEGSLKGGMAGIGDSILDYFIPKFSFASGTDYVPHDMIAQIHKGERIVPAAQNSGGGGGDLRVELINSGTPQKVTGAQPSFDMKGMVLRIFTEDIAQGGRAAKQIEGTYGLNRAAGAM